MKPPHHLRFTLTFMPVLNHDEFHDCDKLYSNDALIVQSALANFKRIDINIVTEYTVGIACAEVRYLTQLLIDPSLDFDDTNEEDASQEIALIRSRFENVFALLFILRSTSTDSISGETVFPLLLELSRIVESVHKSAIFNFIGISSHNNAPVDIWSDVLRTSVVLAICTHCTREDLNIDFCASLHLRDITALLDSPLWQLQLEGLFLLRILLRNRNSEMIPIKDTTISEVRPQPLEKSSMGVSARQNGSSLTYSTASKKALSTAVKSSRQDSLRINKSTKNKGESSLPVASRVLSTNGGRVDELCRNGSLRSIIWLLTNRREVVRKTAAEVLIAIVSAYKQIPSTSNSQDTLSVSSDLWASLVEQGMVALLEAVAAGSRVFVPVNPCSRNGSNDTTNNVNDALPQTYKPTLFPEFKIRCVADFVLRQLTVAIECSEPLSTRLITAMLFSGNAKLRLNIFSSLVFLAGRSTALARRLWNFAPPKSVSTSGTLQHVPTKKGSRDGVAVSAPIQSQSSYVSPPLPPRLQPSAKKEPSEISDSGGGALFRDALSIASKDPTEFRCVLRFLLTLLAHSSMDKSMQPSLVREQPDTVSASDTIRMIKAVAPVVIVNRAGAWTRMACPLLEVICRHSLELGSNIQESIVKQLGNFDNCSAPELVSQRLNSFDDNCFLRLEGSYTIWQEVLAVFSHMADSYLMKLSSANMSAEDLLAALALARRWNMKTLENNYAHVLSRRISNTTLISVLDFCVGYGSSSPYMHPILCISSVDYLVKNYEKINSKDIGDIIRDLTLLIGSLLLYVQTSDYVMIKEEGYENLNAAAKITSLVVPSGQNSTSLLKDQKLEAPLKPEKPVKPKKLCAHTDDTEINNTFTPANESQVSKCSITDKSSPYNSIWSGMKLLPSYINSKVHAVSVASGFSSSTINYFEDVLKSGFLHKMNREGTFQKNIFLLMSDKLVYFKQSVALTLGDDVQALRRVELPSDYHYNLLLLRSSTIMQLDNDEILDVEMRCLVFKILSQKKSFYVRGSAQEDSDQWIAALQSACREAQLSAEGAEISTATAAPVWVPPTEPDCQLCFTPFTLTFRRHHCRNCGKCVCEYCSKDRVRIPRLDADKLFKVCSPCSDVLKASRQYGH